MPRLTTVSTTEALPAISTENLMDHDSSEHTEDPYDRVDEGKVGNVSHSDTPTSTQEEKVPLRIVWGNVILFAYLHLAALYGAYLMITSSKWQTNVFAIFLSYFSGLGVTAGAHRLWAHRSYKARLPLRILLAFMFTISTQNDIHEWVRDHRVHHKHSETQADPHNAQRGFFFAHVGWLLCRKHPDVFKKGKNIDLSDVLADPVVKFQRQYYLRLALVCCVLLPTIIPMYFWNESFLNSFLVSTLFRLCYSLHITWLVNSAAHMWGNRPYDTNINPRENVLVVLITGGEGFHNYHHTFPYDYATSEYGMKYNVTTAFIDLMALFGLAYDRKTASRESIKSRKLRTGEDRLNDQELNYVKRE